MHLLKGSRIALKAVTAHKLQALPAILGIVVGVTAVIASGVERRDPGGLQRTCRFRPPAVVWIHGEPLSNLHPSRKGMVFHGKS